MDRRDFFGTALGAIAGMSMPFMAQPVIPIHPFTKLERLRLGLQAFEEDIKQLYRYRCAVILDDKTEFLSTPVESIDRDIKNLTITAKFKDLNLYKAINVKQLFLLNAEKKVISKLAAEYYLQNGDVFKITYTFGFGA